ncbi:antibiotic biosynthesis monooxygenase [Blastococcus jejuensis]|uniref:Antibiotic biosynthesis monooxygenase n=1 Tax=Blastococcus jejuensis TaxID=351224 RepID=A0ABP6NW26_9ACTN
MYARSTTVHGSPEHLDDGIAYARDDVMPAVRHMTGCIGLSMLCNRESGQSIVTTAWADEAAMHDSESGVWDLRRRMAEVLGGRPEVQEWEIALMHRMHEAHHGACTRVIWGSEAPERLDDHLDAVRMTLLAKMEDLPGFCSVSVMIDRESGRSATSVTYDSRQDMVAATEAATALRTDFARSIGMEITAMTEFDLALSHLRVPEMV